MLKWEPIIILIIDGMSEKQKAQIVIFVLKKIFVRGHGKNILLYIDGQSLILFLDKKTIKDFIVF